MQMANEVLHRADAMGEQAMSAYRRLDALAAKDPCSKANRALLGEIAMEYNYLQAIGYVADDRILCSSAGRNGDGLSLGPTNYVSSTGTRIRTMVDVGIGTRFLILQKDHYAVAVHPQTLLDTLGGRPNVSLGIYGNSQHFLLASRGSHEPVWLTRPHDPSKPISFDGKYLVATATSAQFDLAVYAAIPRSQLESRLHAFILILLPIGLLLGGGMVALILVVARQRASLPAMLRTALKRNAFVLHFQPIVELASGRMVGVEALMRWPANKEVGERPALFIQAAEDCGLIGRFTDYLLRKVVLDARRFFDQHPDCYISLNLSPADLQSERVVKSLGELITTPGVAARNIVVEITEHSFLEPTSANRTIDRIRALGIRVAIDDFGTGYSSLSHLTHLKADYLKIDKVFVDAIGTGSVTSEVVLHIIEMAQSLNLTVIAEGVETPEQADFLRQHGVTYGQGWLYSKARPMVQILEQYGPS